MATQTTPRPFRLWSLLAGSIIINTGSSFVWPLTTIYVHEYLHRPLTTAGFVIFLNCLFSLFGNMMGGQLFDHWRPVRTIILGIALNICTTGLLIGWHTWPIYPVLLMLTGFGNGMIYTCINGFATEIPGRKPSYVFNLLYFTSSLGVVFGTLVVGYVLELGIGYIFAAACSMYALFMLIALRNYRGHALRKGSRSAAKTPRGPLRLNIQVVMVLITIFTVWCFYEQWDSNLSAYMISRHLSVRAYSSVWTVNAVVIILVQPVLTYLDSWFNDHLHGRLYTGLLLLAGSFVLLIGANSYWQFISAMIILSLGEVSAMPAVATFVSRFAPVGSSGRYQGLVQAASSGGRALGPMTGAFIIQNYSYRLLFILAVSLQVVVCAAFALSNRLARNNKVK
ncbi:MFS transporter [Lacticaseibacillus zhaodongensis]|uniref:MFS transporter n=1 Tax=Lacticaseibacillus zhaodongensis TaxID=2668065 RepID=UPI001E2DEC83|nr:MFS transporter [Lacticaseibacillus zhaodongensis]